MDNRVVHLPFFLQGQAKIVLSYGIVMRVDKNSIPELFTILPIRRLDVALRR